MEEPQGQFVPFSCGSTRGIANHTNAVRRALLKPVFRVSDQVRNLAKSKALLVGCFNICKKGFLMMWLIYTYTQLDVKCHFTLNGTNNK